MGRWSVRSREPELLDSDAVPSSEKVIALEQLERVNHWLGGARSLRLELNELTGRLPKRSRLRLVDVGCGAGDLFEVATHWAREHGHALITVGVDRDGEALKRARGRGAAVVRGDGVRLPLADRSADLVTASMFLHHIEDEWLDAVLGELTRVARLGVIVNDLHRHPVALAGWWVWSRLFVRGHMIRHDGAVSVRRGFRPSELARLARRHPELDWEVRRHLPYRVCLTGRRREA